MSDLVKNLVQNKKILIGIVAAITEALKEWELSIIVVKIEKYWVRQSEAHRARVGRYIKKDFVDSMKKVLSNPNIPTE